MGDFNDGKPLHLSFVICHSNVSCWESASHSATWPTACYKRKKCPMWIKVSEKSSSKRLHKKHVALHHDKKVECRRAQELPPNGTHSGLMWKTCSCASLGSQPNVQSLGLTEPCVNGNVDDIAHRSSVIHFQSTKAPHICNSGRTLFDLFFAMTWWSFNAVTAVLHTAFSFILVQTRGAAQRSQMHVINDMSSPSNRQTTRGETQ